MMQKKLFVLIQVAVCQWLFIVTAFAEDIAPEPQIEKPIEIEADNNVHSEVPESKPISLTSETYQLKKENSAGSIGGSTDVGEVVTALIVVLALIVLIAWATKRFNLSGMSIGQTLKLQSVLSLGSKEKIVIVEVEGKKLLLGVTSQNVNLLCHLENDAENNAEVDKNIAASSSNEIGSFAQQIKKVLAQGKLGEDTKAS